MIREGDHFRTASHPCDRCGRPALARWLAGSKPALTVRKSFSLCSECAGLLGALLQTRADVRADRNDIGSGPDGPAWNVGLTNNAK